MSKEILTHESSNPTWATLAYPTWAQFSLCSHQPLLDFGWKSYSRTMSVQTLNLIVGFVIQFMDEKIGPNFKLRPKNEIKCL